MLLAQGKASLKQLETSVDLSAHKMAATGKTDKRKAL